MGVDVALHSTAERALVNALDRIHDGIVVYDREWRFVYLNRSAERYFDRSREELLGLQLQQVFPDVAGTEIEQRLQTAASATGLQEFTSFAPVRRRWVAFRTYPSDVGLTVYFRDVTEQKAVEDALRESEERHRALFEHSLSAMLLTAPTGEILAANPAACRMFEMTEAEICAGGRGLLVDLSDPRGAAFLEMRGRTGHASGELRCLRKGGRPFPAEVTSVVFKEASGAERTSMVIHDLTSRKRAEESVALLAEAGEVLVRSLELEGILQHLPRLFVPRFADACVVDLLDEGTVRRMACGRAAAEQDVRMAPLDPGPWHQVFGGVLSARRAQLVAPPTEAWLRAVAPGWVPRTGGSAEAPTSLLVLPLIARDRAAGVVVLARAPGRAAFDAADLTLGQGLADRVATAIDNGKLYNAALEARRVRDDVLGIVSHDLRNPLNGIALTAQILARRRPEESEPATILRAVRVADQLINDLLLAAKLESGTLGVKPRPVPVRDIVDEVLTLARPVAEQRSVVLGASVAQDVTEACVDRQRVAQLLGNLVSNALKFTPPGGRVTVHARSRPEALELAVSDTGPGIAPEQVPHLFDRFWQGAHAHSADAGLGLSIAKGLAEAHGGAIHVETELGHGATFVVELPWHEAAPESAA